jgi:hypothetical protein
MQIRYLGYQINDLTRCLAFPYSWTLWSIAYLIINYKIQGVEKIVAGYKVVLQMLHNICINRINKS